MTSAASRLRVQEHEDVLVVEFVDRHILDEANIQQIGEELTRLVDASEKPKLLVSFENVDHLSSAALGTLITINNRIRGRDGQLRLANIDPQIHDIFRITKLDKVFHIHRTTEDAMNSFT